MNWCCIPKVMGTYNTQSPWWWINGNSWIHIQFCTHCSTWSSTSFAYLTSIKSKMHVSMSPNASTYLLSWTSTIRSFLINKTRRIKLLDPSQHWLIYEMENTFFVSIWLPRIPKIVLVRSPTINKCLSCCNHQSKRSFVLSIGTHMCGSTTIFIKLVLTHKKPK